MTEFIGDVLEVRQETPDVKTFRIAKPKGFSFIPGQYCLVAFIDKFNGESRPFTFTTSPLVKDYFELTIKQMHEFTTALHGLKKGEKLRINGPMGEALNYNENQDAVFIAGGSGITPFISMIRYNIAKKLKSKIILLFSNRTEKDVIFRKELDAIKQKNIQVVHTLTSETPNGWKGETGYVSEAMIKKHVKNLNQYLWYVVGPPAMIQSMRSLLANLQIDNIRIDEWQLPGKK